MVEMSTGFRTEEVQGAAALQWAARARDHGGGWLYTRPEWLRVVADGLGYEPCVLITTAENGSRVAATPGMRLRKGPFLLWGSPLRGAFTEFLGPVFADGLHCEDKRAVLLAQHVYLRKRRFSYIEWCMRDAGVGECLDVLSNLGYRPLPQTTLVLDPRMGEEAVWKGFAGRARNMVRKAEKNSVSIRNLVPDADRAVRYYELLEGTFRRRGLKVPHPRRFFRLLCDRLSPLGWLRLFEAVCGGESVAAALFLVYGGRMLYFSGASTERGRRLAAASLIQWHAIRYACAHGMGEFDLGGTGGDPGIDRFKAGFGGVPVQRPRWVCRTAAAAFAERIHRAVVRGCSR